MSYYSVISKMADVIGESFAVRFTLVDWRNVHFAINKLKKRNRHFILFFGKKIGPTACIL
jgi:hypothetical protein